MSATATVAPVDHAVVMVLDQAGIFGQAFFEKGCDHAASRVFDQTFSQKVCDQTFFEKVCGTREAELGCRSGTLAAKNNLYPLKEIGFI